MSTPERLFQMTPALFPRLAAEALGAFLLVGLGVSGAVAASYTDAASGLLLVALAHGLGLAVAIHAFGSVSGAHLNPTVTLALAFRRRFPWSELPPYIIAQLLGGVAAAAVVVGIFGGFATDAGLGATVLAEGVTPVQGLLAEAFGAFVLVLAVHALAVEPGTPKGLVGLGIGLSLAVGILAVGLLTGASFNLARTLGPDVVLALSGGPVAWGQLGVYLVGPLIGGLAAALAYDLTRRPSRDPAVEEDGPVQVQASAGV
jgi:glycerol uptake facilitator protein